MSGHSKWSTIKRKKGAADAARARVFTKLIREITISARLGGGDPEANPRLRLAIQNAKSANMPMQNVERAIKKGTGELEGQHYEEVTYEGYGPGGAAILIDAITDNRNRTLSDIRHLFTRYNGNLAETNAVAFMFDRKAVVEVEAAGRSEDEIMEAALEAGAEDLEGDEDGVFTITGEPRDLEPLRAAMEELGVNIRSAESTFVPQNYTQVDEKHAGTLLKLMDALDDHDDVQKVYSNLDIDEELLQKMAEA
ncbi:MAG: putative transcriptional regulatory protein [Calditrichaeota bacterium]|nr:putative transcriptional regulatory protein [Calditrichota bacterium]